MKRIRRDGRVQWSEPCGNNESLGGDLYRFHRVGAPAVIYEDGQSAWHTHGRLHRDVRIGAAGIRPGGQTLWTEETFFENGNSYRKTIWR
jgi:hypothetical protein